MRTMIRIAAFAALATFAAHPAPAQTKKAAQPAHSHAAEVLAMWNNVGHKLITMAEDFPEAKYDFKPNPAQRSFAEQLLHVAASDFGLMSAVKGSKAGPGNGEDLPRADYKTKADVVKILKQAVEDGAALLKEQGDAGLNKEVKYPYGNRMVHASFVWWDAIEHSGEHYGQLVVYYRVNNMVPPASRPRK